MEDKELCSVCEKKEATEMFADEVYCTPCLQSLVNTGEAIEDTYKDETNEF